MIPLDRLQAIKHIIVHENCADGVASALILKDALPHADVRFVQYNTHDHINLPAVEGMIFCDFSPHPSRVEEFLGVNAIVLDHHKGPAEAITRKFEERGLGAFASEVTDPGKSGAYLAYTQVWLPLKASFSEDRRACVEDLAFTAGIYDTWQTKAPQWRKACEQKEALLWWPWAKIEHLPPSAWSKEILNLGPILYDRNLERVRKCIDGAHTFTTSRGTRVMVFEGTKPSSDASELVGDAADLVIGFAYRIDKGEQRLICSTRSRTTYNCRAFALAHGGSGHTKAAGFGWDLNRKDLQPFALLETLLERYESVLPTWLNVIAEPGFDQSVAEGLVKPRELYQNLVLSKTFTLTPPALI